MVATQQELRENAAEDSSSRRAHDRTIEQRRKARLAREAAMTPRVQRDPTNSPDAALNALDIRMFSVCLCSKQVVIGLCSQTAGG